LAILALNQNGSGDRTAWLFLIQRGEKLRRRADYQRRFAEIRLIAGNDAIGSRKNHRMMQDRIFEIPNPSPYPPPDIPILDIRPCTA
jgi:hypothetical protein